MANYNLGSFNKMAQKYNVTGHQLIMGKANGNVIGMLLGGYKFDSLGNFTKLDIDMLFSTIACKGVAEAYKEHTYGKNSVAKQKVNNAHGRMDGERLVNFLEQSMTYADPFANVQFKGHTWISVFNQLVESRKCEVVKVENWKESMKHWHENSVAVVERMLNNKEIRVFDGYAIPSEVFKKFLNKYCEENNYNTLPEDKMNYMIDSYEKRFNEVVGV